MGLVAVERDELLIGQPLRWPLYDQQHNTVMKKGAVITDAAHLKSVLDLNPLRELDLRNDHGNSAANQSAGANPNHEQGKASGNVFTFGDMKLRVGDRIQLQPPPSMGPERHLVKLIGYVDHASVLTTAPSLHGMRVPLREGDKIVARVFTSQTAFAFDSIVERICKIPYDYLHLSYPAEVQGAVIRQAPRIKTNIIASIARQGAPDSESRVSGVIVNISAHGALLCTNKPITEPSQKITLWFRVNLQGLDTYLSIQAVIRNLHADEEKDDSSPLKYQHGVQFLNLQGTDRMILQSLIYQQMIEQPHTLI